MYSLSYSTLIVAVSGSPFMVHVGGQPSGRVRETKTIQVQNAELVSPGQTCTMQLKIPGMFIAMFDCLFRHGLFQRNV